MTAPLALGETVFLLRPLWLAALLPVGLLWIVLHRIHPRGAWSAVIDPRLFAALRDIGQVRPARPDRSAALPLTAAALLALGLAGPAVMRPGAVEYRALDPLVIVLDLSPSVARGPALADLQAAAAFLLGHADSRPVGLMLYAADAYVASAPTTDAASLQSLIAVLAPDIMPVVGSRPDIALAQTRDIIGGDGPGIAGADVVVISDGGGAGPAARAEAARLRAEGARVWALSLDRTAPDAPTPDRGALVQIAQAGGGAEMPAREPRLLMERIASARTARLAESRETAHLFRDLGPWLAALALVTALPLYRRRA